jgi:hypothetical protein
MEAERSIEELLQELSRAVQQHDTARVLLLLMEVNRRFGADRSSREDDQLPAPPAPPASA